MAADQANTLKQVFDAIDPCIKKCMMGYPCYDRDLLQYFYPLHAICTHIVTKHIDQNPTWTPSMFSEAVHEQVKQQNYYTDENWRVVAAVFEYTCMRIEACLKQQASRDAYGAQIRETHTTVRETHGKLDSFERKLDELLSLLKKVSGESS